MTPLPQIPSGLYGFREAVIKRVVTADPAANAEWTFTVPANTAWLLRSVSAALAQGITDTPQPLLVIKDAAGNVLSEHFGSTTVQAVSTTQRYSWVAGGPLTGNVGATTNVHSNGTLPCDLVLLAGWTISSNTIGLAATADWGIASARVVEYT